MNPVSRNPEANATLQWLSAELILPPDLSEPEAVKELLERIDQRLAAGSKRVTIDGGGLKWCNSAFAEAMIQIGLRVRAAGATCEVRGLSAHALDVIDVCQLRHVLERAGVVLVGAS